MAPFLSTCNSQLALGRRCISDNDPFVVVSSACCGTAVFLLWFPLLAVSADPLSWEGPYIEQLQIMTWDTHCIVRMNSGDPVEFVLLRGKTLKIFQCWRSSPFGGPSYFVPKVGLLDEHQIPWAHLSHSHLHTQHALRFLKLSWYYNCAAHEYCANGLQKTGRTDQFADTLEPIVFCMSSNCFQNSLSQLGNAQWVSVWTE